MKLERSKNAARNMVFGTISKIYNLIVPFIMRTIMIYTLGMAYTGLNSLFSSVLSVLNLAELGVGSAMVFSMYKPIAEDDTKKLCALMRLYKIYYRVIGLVIMVLGLLITPAIPYLIKSDVPPDINIYVLYLMNLFMTVLSYWLFAYKNCLLFAHQRNDIGDKIGYVINTVKYVAQILVLVLFKNYYVYILVAMFMGVVSNIVTAVVVDKLYPQYKAVGELSKSEVRNINQKVKDLFTAKIGSIVINSSDTIVISAFLGLEALALYQNYYFILSSVYGFVALITGSSLAGIGNSLVTESREKNFKDLKTFSFIISWISGFCVCCFACLYQPFMELWVGDKNLLSYGMVILFCIYFFVQQIQGLLLLYKDASGMWHEDKFRPLVTALANLIMNIVMVQFWGLYGILLSTILSILLIGMPWLLHNLFTTLFRTSPVRYIGRLLLYALIAVVSCAMCIFCTGFEFSSIILTLFVRLVICGIIPNVIFFVLFRKTDEFKSFVNIICGLTGNRLAFLKKLV